MDPRITKLADLLTNYSCGVKPGEKLLVECIGFDAVPLVHEVVHAATQAGGIVFTNIRHDRLTRRFLHDADEEQIKAQAKYDAIRMKDMQCYIGVRGTPNTMEMGDVPADKLRLWNKYYNDPVHMKIRVPKTRWVVLRWPNDSMAQNAQMPLHPFEDFYFDVCTLDYAKMSRAMDPLKAAMEATDQVDDQGPRHRPELLHQGDAGHQVRRPREHPRRRALHRAGEGQHQRHDPLQHRQPLRGDRLREHLAGLQERQGRRGRGGGRTPRS